MDITLQPWLALRISTEFASAGIVVDDLTTLFAQSGEPEITTQHQRLVGHLGLAPALALQAF